MLGVKLFKLVLTSRQHEVGFRDPSLMLEGDAVLWDSLLTFVLCVTKVYSRTVVAASSTCVCA
jgi:hypothetical protein